MNLFDLIRTLAPAGQSRLRDTALALVRHFAPEAPKPAPDRLLEPLLFAWFSSPNPPGSLDTLLAEPIVRPRVGPLELIAEPHPLLERFFTDEHGVAHEVEISSTAQRCAPQIRRALELLARHAPEVHESVLIATRALLVFDAPAMNSFAAPRAHGIAFLNAALGDDEVFFIEDIAHQGGHVVFHAMTLEGAFLCVPNDTPMAAVVGRDDLRTVLDALHGLFTEALIAIALTRCAASAEWTERQRHELEGRLAMILCRYRGDLEDLAHPDLFSDAGLELLRILHSVFAGLAADHAALVQSCDFSNQQYNFDYARFRALNPAVYA